MSTPKAPTAPKFKPAAFSPLSQDDLQFADVAGAQQTATDTDRAAYAAADADFAARHPDLVTANRVNEANAAGAVRGELPPGYADTLVKAGLGKALGAFGGGGGGAGVRTNSAGQFDIAKNLGINFLDYQNNAARNLAALNAATPERTFGLGGQGVLQLELGNQALANQATIGNFQGANQVGIANTGNQNNANQGSFAAALNASNAQGAQNAQYAAAAASLAGKFIGGSGGSAASGVTGSLFSGGGVG